MVQSEQSKPAVRRIPLVVGTSGGPDQSNTFAVAQALVGIWRLQNPEDPRLPQGYLAVPSNHVWSNLNWLVQQAAIQTPDEAMAINCRAVRLHQGVYRPVYELSYDGITVEVVGCDCPSCLGPHASADTEIKLALARALEELLTP